MDLLEYQAKRLFQQVGIPVLRSQSILDPSELKDLQVPYPVVLKSQVRASSRAKVGGVKFVENTIDAIAAAQAIFHLPIENEYPGVILAESRYDVQDELFLGIRFDYQLKKPVLLGSSQGGIEIETLLENLQTYIIDVDFSPFHARRLAKDMGFSGKTLLSISNIVAKMYDLFIEQDLEVIEINPLGINSQGEVMALDGKIRVNDEALARHPRLLDLIGINNHDHDNQFSKGYLTNFISPLHQLNFFEVNQDSNVGIIANSVDSAIFTANFLLEQNLSVKSCFILSDNQDDLQTRLEKLLKQIFDSATLEFIVVNIIANQQVNLHILQTISEYYKRNFTSRSQNTEERSERPTGRRRNTRSTKKSPQVKPRKQVKWLLRMIEIDEQEITSLIDGFPIEITNNLDTLIKDIKTEIEQQKKEKSKSKN